ncbi:MAG: hypothetical protein JST86_11230 [Bacteroidetes bacterium]|nr:hypothetical protein [Bacteroidota bacterium]
MPKSICIFLALILVFGGAKSQLTTENFKLCLDNISCADSSFIHITKEQLLKSKKIIPNYSWFIIDSTIIYIGRGNYTSEIISAILPKDEFTKESSKLFERLQTGSFLTITVTGHNKQHTPVEWGMLSIEIVDKK